MWIETKTKCKSLLDLETGNSIDLWKNDKEARSRIHPHIRYNCGTIYKEIFEGTEAECHAEYDRLKALLINGKQEKKEDLQSIQEYLELNEKSLAFPGTVDLLLKHFNITRKK